MISKPGSLSLISRWSAHLHGVVIPCKWKVVPNQQFLSSKFSTEFWAQELLIWHYLSFAWNDHTMQMSWPSWYQRKRAGLWYHDGQLCFLRFILSWEFITVTNMHIFPIHEQYIKYLSVLRALYNSSMIKHRKVGSVSFSKMEVNIVIFITIVNLFPDTWFYLLLFIFPNQVSKTFLSKFE